MTVEPRRRGKPAKKYSQAARLHDVIRLLEARYGATVDELAEECGVTRRTIYRDLQAIEDAGYPLVSEPAGDGRTLHRFISSFSRIPPVAFSLEELMTLYFCRGQLSFLQGTPFQEDLDAIFGRIRSVLPPRSVAHLERIASAAAPKFLGVRDYAEKKELLKQLRKALLHQYRCRLEYTPPHREMVEYLFDPYTLLFHKDSLYLGGYAHNRSALRLFLVDRVASVELLDDRFEVPEDYRVEQLTGESFGLIDEGAFDIRVRFSSQVAHLVRERTWHPSQRLQLAADGSVEMQLRASGETELLSWLYSYLPHVEVLEPASLRQRFAEGLQVALQKHL